MSDPIKEKAQSAERAGAVHNTDLTASQIVHHMPYSPYIAQYRAQISEKYPGHIWEDISDEEFLKTIWVL